MKAKLLWQIISAILGILLGGGGLITAGVGTYNYGFYGEAPSTTGWTSILSLLGSGGLLTVIVPMLLQYFWPKADPDLAKQVFELITALKGLANDPNNRRSRWLVALEAMDIQFSLINSLSEPDAELEMELKKVSLLLHERLGPGTAAVVTPPPVTSRRR